MNALIARGLNPERIAALPHGVRARYSIGCRCVPCRKANSEYESARARARKAGEWNGLVAAEPTRLHLMHLSRLGIGYKTVADQSGVSRTTLGLVKARKKTRIRALSAAAVLRVDGRCHSDGALVSAAGVRQRIARLVGKGMSKASIARRLGLQRGALQYTRPKVTELTRQRFIALEHRLRTQEADARKVATEDARRARAAASEAKRAAVAERLRLKLEQAAERKAAAAQRSAERKAARAGDSLESIERRGRILESLHELLSLKGKRAA